MQDALAGIGHRARAVLSSKERWALFTDIDGTLLGVAPTPDAVRVPADLVMVLDAVMRGVGGAFAVLTGRPIAKADRLLAPLAFVAAGVHGTELRSEPHGPISALAPSIPASVMRAVEDLESVAPGALVEPKGCGVAVHYRAAPGLREVVEREMAAIIAASSADLVLRPGRMVLEALPRGYSKGTALAALARAPPFEGRLPIMVGDDAGDESAFAAAGQLGGLALRVAGEHFTTDMADFGGVDSVHAWLKALAGKLASHRGA
jgi:trehalose 6-phosphate phosphatase